MKRLAALFGCLVLCLVPAMPSAVRAMNVDAGKQILAAQNITADTEWQTISLAAYKPKAKKIGSLYLVMFVGVSSTCPGDTVQFKVRPFDDDKDERIMFARATSGDPENSDEHVQYVWLPVKSDKLEWRVESISCENAKVNAYLGIVGYEFKDPRRWKLIYGN